MMKTLVRLFIVSISLGLCISAYSAEGISKITYKWVDQQGITQYTERPPKDGAYEKITVHASGGEEVTGISAAQAANSKEEIAASPLDEIAKVNESNCKVAKQNMEVLTNVARIKVSDEKGENRILTPEEKQARLDETQRQIDIFCKDSPAK